MIKYSLVIIGIIVTILILYSIYMILYRINKNRRKELVYFLIGEDEMGLIYKVFLPATVDSDVIKRTLKVVVNGKESLVELPGDCKDTLLDPIVEGSNVALSLMDTDDAGNDSGWSEALVFSAVDTIVPSTPGMLSVKVTAEVADSAPSPEPEPAPVTPEPPVVEVVDEVPAPAPEPDPTPAPVVEADAVVTPVEPPAPPTE